MQRFMVNCFNHGQWDQEKPRVVEASDEREAAQQVCGGNLSEADALGQLRATVASVETPSKKVAFYAHHQSCDEN
ncbi:MAG: hypothetical protein ACR2RE_24690 [Geminicoccaceae bacterium]